MTDEEKIKNALASGDQAQIKAAIDETLETLTPQEKATAFLQALNVYLETQNADLRNYKEDLESLIELETDTKSFDRQTGDLEEMDKARSALA